MCKNAIASISFTVIEGVVVKGTCHDRHRVGHQPLMKAPLLGTLSGLSCRQLYPGLARGEAVT